MVTFHGCAFVREHRAILLACKAKEGKQQSTCDAHKTDGAFDKSKCDGDSENCKWDDGTQGTMTGLVECKMLRLDPCARDRTRGAAPEGDT